MGASTHSCPRFLLPRSEALSTSKNPPPAQAPPRAQGSALVLHEYALADCELWFIKFSMDFACRLLALGNRRGRVWLWDATVSPPALLARLAAPGSSNTSENPVRQTAVSFDGRTILAACDDGSVVRWDDHLAAKQGGGGGGAGGGAGGGGGGGDG